MTVAHINGEMLTWARERAGFEQGRLVKGNITIDKLKAWESGKQHPSEAQATYLAERLGISYAMLFMPIVPPPDNPSIPDLRTLDGHPIKNPSLDFREVLNDTIVRQDWVRDERREESKKPLAFVGRFSLSDSPIEVASDMRRVLRLTTNDRLECHDYEAFIKHIVSRAEATGILVMRSAVVGHSTNRTLSVNEFRGFSLSDPIAPVIFVNDADAKAAQIFTIAHELTHIWIAADGVSDRKPNQKKESRNSIELFSDQVAAELLAPTDEFKASWRTGSTMERARRSATHFRVSTLVALRRAKDLGLISVSDFISNVDVEYERFREIDKRKRDEQKKREKKGGNFWASFEIRNGRAFNSLVISALARQRTTYTEAAGLLGVTVASTIRYQRRVGAS